ncbi:hypothetical protein D3C86_1449570 [compost metagenome]
MSINCFYRLWKNNSELKLFIFGHSRSYIVDTFKENLDIKLKNNPNFANNIRFFSHPSKGHLHKSIGRYIIDELIKNDEIKLNYSKMLDGISK